MLEVVSPKDHAHEGKVPATATEVFVNVMEEFAQFPDDVKSALGAGCISITVVVVSTQPEAEVAMSVIV